MKTVHVSAVTALLAGALFGCAGGLDDPSLFLGDPITDGGGITDDPEAFYRNLCGDPATVPEFLVAAAGCGGCHFDGSTLGNGFDLTSPGLVDRVNGVNGQCPTTPIADPANPDASTMSAWLEGTVSGCTTGQMPPIGAGATADEISCAKFWIDMMDNTFDGFQ